MSGFYEPFRAIPALFVEAGALVSATLTRTSAGGFDPATLKPAANSTTTIDGHGILETVKTKASDGSLVRTLIAHLNIEAQVGDTLTLGGKTYNVREVSLTAPDGVMIMCEATLS